MAGSKDWADAHLAQAAEDLTAAKKLGGRVPSVLAMLLQMVFEKTAKAALLRSSEMTVAKARASHRSASRMVAVLKRNRSILHKIGGRNAYAWKDVLPVVTELERAHPQLSEGGPQLEYPRQDVATDEVLWLARDLPIAHRLGAPGDLTGSRTLKFATQLIKAFDEVFPP